MKFFIMQFWPGSFQNLPLKSKCFAQLPLLKRSSKIAVSWVVTPCSLLFCPGDGGNMLLRNGVRSQKAVIFIIPDIIKSKPSLLLRVWYGMFRGGFPHALRPLCGLLYVPCEFSTRERRNHHLAEELKTMMDGMSTILLRGPLGT
jgi:hypothetical protein